MWVARYDDIHLCLLLALNLFLILNKYLTCFEIFLLNLNPFQVNVPFIHFQKTSQNFYFISENFFLYFQGLWKGNIGLKVIKGSMVRNLSVSVILR